MQISEQQAQELTAHERRAERARDEVEVIITEIQERTAGLLTGPEDCLHRAASGLGDCCDS